MADHLQQVLSAKLNSVKITYKGMIKKSIDKIIVETRKDIYIKRRRRGKHKREKRGEKGRITSKMPKDQMSTLVS